MLFQLGTITLDTRPFNADEMSRSADASLPVKGIMGAAPRREFTGEGDDNIQLTGDLLPLHIGGLDELELAHGYRRSGERIPVMRGDGKMMGWFAIASITENHTNLGRDGVGMTVKYQISLVRTQVGETGVISSLLALFNAL